MCIFCLTGGRHRPEALFEGIARPGGPATAADSVAEQGDAPDSLATPARFEPEQRFTGTISSADDTDYVRVWLEQGATYDLEMTGSAERGGAALSDPVLWLRDLQGTQLAYNDDGGPGRDARITHTAGHTGWHVLQAEGFAGATGGYALTAAQHSYHAFHEDQGDAPGNSSTPYSLAEWTPEVNAFWDGAIDHRGDLDWVEIHLEAGRTYRLTAQGWGDTPARDLEMWLFDDTETELAYDEDSFFDDNPLILFHALRTGSYFLSVRHAQDSATGDYFLEYYETGFDLSDPDDMEPTDAPDSAATPYHVAEGGLFVGAIDAPGDVDWLEIDLQAGRTYMLRAEETWRFWDGLQDPFLQLFDATGALIASDDDAGPGSDAAIRFTPDANGTYFMAVSAATTDGTGVGYYEASVTLEDAKTDPLDAIRWGTGTLPVGDGPVLVHFHGSGWYVSPDGEIERRLDDFTEAETAFILQTLATIGTYTPLRFARTEDAAQADMQVFKTDLKGFSGFANPPGAGWLPDSAIFLDNWEGYWTPAMLKPGSFTHGTILHEAGHALGLAHPHDTGGTSEILRGVLSSGDTGGATGFHLNQFPFSIMSYNELWNGLAAEPAFEDGIGGLATHGALDMAVLQELYGTGANRPGNSTYRLDRDHFETIWDSGGVDTIRATGFADAVIDLTAATLDYSDTGGGVVSHQQGTFGGVTIAHGVQIERAYGARGDDTITGNGLDNTLRGGNGRDWLAGLDGDDLILGGRGLDEILGGDGRDDLRGGAGGDTILGNRGADRILGNSGNDRIEGGNGGDIIDGGRGNDVIAGGTGNDILDGGAGADVFVFAEGDGTDTILAFQDIDRVDLTGFGPALGFADLTISDTGPAAARVTIAGSATAIDFADLRTVLEARHFDFADAVA